MEIAADIAEEVGTEIMRLRTEGVDVAATKSSLTDVVTESDRLAENLIFERLRASRPNDAILGEEGTRYPGTTEITWVIDPIDGTVNYLYDLVAYCVSIAACVNDETAYSDGKRAVAAAVFNPKTNELFKASTGNGAFLNGDPLSVSKETVLAKALIGTGFGYTAERRLEQHRILGKVIARVRDIRRIGTAAYDLCLVASGRLDGYFEKGIKPWDWAAGALIATEAGALTLGQKEDDPAGEDFFIAGPPIIAHELQALLAQ